MPILLGCDSDIIFFRVQIDRSCQVLQPLIQAEAFLRSHHVAEIHTPVGEGKVLVSASANDGGEGMTEAPFTVVEENGSC